MTIKDLSADERPREKAARFGVQSLTNAECLAILLRTGIPGHPITEIARDLMKHCDNKFLLLERLTDEQIMETPGIGAVKVQEIRTVLEIMRRYAAESIGDRPVITQSADVYEIMKYDLRNLSYEQMWVLFVDNGNHLISRMRVSEGSATATVHDNKKILKEALLRGANGLFLCHNHPSGTLKPSGPDQQITTSLANACHALDIRFLDHLIISTEGFYSFHDHGQINP